LSRDMASLRILYKDISYSYKRRTCYKSLLKVDIVFKLEECKPISTGSCRVSASLGTLDLPDKYNIFMPG